MKKYLFLFLIVAGSFFYYTFFLKIKPCEKPLYYDVGSIDPRHKTTKEEFLSLIQKAETVWEKPWGKNLFEYKEDARLSINLVFDEKQKEILRIAEEEDRLDSERTSLQEEKSKLDLIQNRYEKAVTEYENEVRLWNEGPRTNQKTFKALKEKEATVSALNKLLKEEVETYNTLVQEYNKKVENFNHTASFEGQAGVAHGDKEVNIFILNNDVSDIFLIAHELGHALGIEGHGKDPRSLMFYKLPQDITKISDEDILFLQELCGK
jgi:hypothetical protein